MASPAQGGTGARRHAWSLATPAQTPGGPYVAGTPRWDPCAPVPWHLDPAGAPRHALAQAREAVRRVAKATGLRFTESSAAGGITIRFAAHATGSGEVGQGGWTAEAVGSDPLRWRITSGFVVLDRGEAARLKEGFGPGPTLGQALMHELGHAVGLGHSRDSSDVMYPYTTHHRAVWGAGDRIGLELVGADQGCLPDS